MNKFEQAKAFRKDVAKYPNWNLRDKNLANGLALLIAMDAGSYDPATKVMIGEPAKLRDLVAAGKLQGPANATISLSQSSDEPILCTPTPTGIQTVIKVDGEYRCLPGNRETMHKILPPMPSTEAFVSGTASIESWIDDCIAAYMKSTEP